MKNKNNLNNRKELEVWMAFNPDCPEQSYNSEDGEVYIGCIWGSRRYNLFLNRDGTRRIASNKYGDLIIGVGHSLIPAAYKGFDICYLGSLNQHMDPEDQFILHALGMDELWVKNEEEWKKYFKNDNKTK